MNHFKEKQIADTIIQQQKKLLDHIQRTGGTTKNIDLTTSKKLKLPKTNKKSNPLLANLSKPSVPYKFSQSITTTTTTTNESGTDTLKSGTSSIEAELNSNYVAYETLNRVRRPPNTSAPPPPSQQPSIKPETTAPSSALVAKPFIQKPEANRNIHVFITGLNTFPVHCHVCQHLIPLIAYASKCQICS